MEVNGHQNYLVPNILENILFSVPQKKGYHKGFEDMLIVFWLLVTFYAMICEL